MSLLFYVDTKNNTVIHPEVVKLCPSFQALNEKEVLYVVLYADYNSIYKQFPEHDRKRKAMWHAFNDNETELVDSERIKYAIQDYISLQYSPKIETINSYQKKIDSLLAQLEAEDSPVGIEKIDKAIGTLRKRIDDMQNEVNADTIKKSVLKGGKTKSFLEEIMSNQKHYFSVIGKKV